MAQASDDYSWEEILERLDISFGDFSTMGSLIARLDQVLGRPASAHQIDLSVVLLQTQRQQAIDLGYSIDQFIRGGNIVTQLRGPRGQFVASTEIPLGATSTKERLRVGDIAAALRRAAG